jgi:hypothetical protein
MFETIVVKGGEGISNPFDLVSFLNFINRIITNNYSDLSLLVSFYREWGKYVTTIFLGEVGAKGH